MTLQPHHGGNAMNRLDQKPRKHNRLHASPCRHLMPYGIGAAWAVRDRVKIVRSDASP